MKLCPTPFHLAQKPTGVYHSFMVRFSLLPVLAIVVFAINCVSVCEFEVELKASPRSLMADRALDFGPHSHEDQNGNRHEDFCGDHDQLILGVVASKTATLQLNRVTDLLANISEVRAFRLSLTAEQHQISTSIERGRSRPGPISLRI